MKEIVMNLYYEDYQLLVVKDENSFIGLSDLNGELLVITGGSISDLQNKFVEVMSDYGADDLANSDFIIYKHYAICVGSGDLKNPCGHVIATIDNSDNDKMLLDFYITVENDILQNSVK